jgi:azurin
VDGRAAAGGIAMSEGRMLAARRQEGERHEEAQGKAHPGMVGGETLVPGTGVSLPGVHARFTATLKPGTYNLYCSIPGHRAMGMVRKLVVT